MLLRRNFLFSSVSLIQFGSFVVLFKNANAQVSPTSHSYQYQYEEADKREGAKWPACPCEPSIPNLPIINGWDRNRFIYLWAGYNAQIYGMWFREDGPPPDKSESLENSIQRKIGELNKVIGKSHSLRDEEHELFMRSRYLSMCTTTNYSIPKNGSSSETLGRKTNAYRNGSDSGLVIPATVLARKEDSIIEIGLDAVQNFSCGAGYLWDGDPKDKKKAMFL